MEGPLKELAKLEKLTANKGKTPTFTDSLDSLLRALQTAKDELIAHGADEESLLHLVHTAEATKREVDDRQKEVYSSISRFGKALDKVIPSHHRLRPTSFTLHHRNSPMHCRHTQTCSPLKHPFQRSSEQLPCTSYGLDNSIQPRLFLK